MKIQHPALVRAIGAAGAFGVRRLVGTSRFHFRYMDPRVNPEFARRSGARYIYAFFHEVMLFPAYFWAWPEMQILISDHRDGELIAQVVRRLGFGVVRGSTTRGGARALREMAHRVDHGHLCVTPDGPKGPRRHVHQGLAYLSSRTGLPIVGAGMAFADPWRAQSWDRFAVPRPFSRRRLRGARGRGRAAGRQSRPDRSRPRRGRAADERGHRRGRSLGARAGLKKTSYLASEKSFGDLGRWRLAEMAGDR